MSSQLFNHRHTLRRWARWVLLLWLLGVGAAVAHACVVGATAAANRSTAGELPAAAEGGHGADCDGAAAGAAESGCLALCERSYASAAPLKTALADLPGLGLAPLLSATAWLLPALPVPASAARPRERVQAPPVPIAIALLRLAL